MFVGYCLLPIVGEMAADRPLEGQGVPALEPAPLPVLAGPALIPANPIALFRARRSTSCICVHSARRSAPGAAIFSRSIPVCTDMLTIGAGTVIREDTVVLGYRAAAGMIQIGPITMGNDVLVGEKTVLEIGTSIGDGAQLGHARRCIRARRPGRRELARVTRRPLRRRLPRDRRRALRHGCAGSGTASCSCSTCCLLAPLGLALVLWSRALPCSAAARAGTTRPRPGCSTSRCSASRGAVPRAGSLAGLVVVATVPRLLHGVVRDSRAPALRYPLLGPPHGRAPDERAVLPLALRRQLLHRPLPEGARVPAPARGADRLELRAPSSRTTRPT